MEVILEKPYDLRAGLGIQIAGRFICKEHCGFRRDRREAAFFYGKADKKKDVTSGLQNTEARTQFPFRTMHVLPESP